MDVLTKNIKFDNSKVLEGRILALKLSNNTAEDFAQKAENLADLLRCSLVFEGINPEKANEITIDKTVELCRSNTNSGLVKSVLESTKFDTPQHNYALHFYGNL